MSTVFTNIKGTRPKQNVGRIKNGAGMALLVPLVAGLLLIGGCTGTNSSLEVSNMSNNRGVFTTVEQSDTRKILEILIHGNRNHVEGKRESQPLSPSERAELAKGQKPIAIVLTCSDSRVIPEYFFDLPEGKLFVCRVAGNVLDRPTLGSIEYAAEHLGARLLIVIGHTRCGAVKAACEPHGEVSENIGAIVEQIKPAVEKVMQGEGTPVSSPLLLDEVVEQNVEGIVKRAKASPEIAELVKKHGLVVKGAVYDIETGKVEFIE